MNNLLNKVKNKYFALASLLAILFSITAALGGANGFDEVIQFYGLEGIINSGKRNSPRGAAACRHRRALPWPCPWPGSISIANWRTPA